MKFCLRCRMSLPVCYCEHVRPFAAGPLIVTLVHPKENRKKIGTNRIVQLGISNSLRVQGTGESLDQNPEIERLITDPNLDPTVLYPGKNALNLDTPQADQLLERVQHRRLLVFVIDGTWALAQQMLHRSHKLGALPQLMFNPDQPSTYRIRRQPHSICLSTVEAVHALLERLDQKGIYALPPDIAGQRAHTHLLRVFDKMVDRQLEFQNRRV